jgi:hypothetical protein
MVDNKQFQQVHEATSDLAHSYQQTSQAVMDSILTLQEYNLKLAQSLFSVWFGGWFGSGMEPRPLQKESTESSQQQWGQQTQKQQEAFQRLAAASMRMYTGMLLAPFTFWTPFSFSRQTVDAAATELERERERVLKRLAYGLQYAYGQESRSEVTT